MAYDFPDRFIFGNKFMSFHLFLIGLLIGFGFFLLQRLIESGTVVFQLNPVLLAWLPTALLALVTFILLARTR